MTAPKPCPECGGEMSEDAPDDFGGCSDEEIYAMYLRVGVGGKCEICGEPIIQCGCECYDEWAMYCTPERPNSCCPNGIISCTTDDHSMVQEYIWKYKAHFLVCENPECGHEEKVR